MGQKSSTQLQEFIPSFVNQIFNDDSPTFSILTEEINNMTYEDFVKILGELNILSKKCLDSSNQRLVFAVKKGTDTSYLWKATVRIACVKLNPDSNSVNTYGLMNLIECLKVYKTLKCEFRASQQSSKSEQSDGGQSKSVDFEGLLNSGSELEDSDQFLCCICLERPRDLLLPCTHSYCGDCLDRWTSNNQSCPICRETVEDTDDAWVLADAPTSEEVTTTMRSDLLKLTSRRNDSCTQS